MQELPQFPPKRQAFSEVFIGVEFIRHPLREIGWSAFVAAKT